MSVTPVIPARGRRADACCAWSGILAAVAALVFTCSAAAAQSGTIGIETANEAAGVQFLEPGRWGVVRTVIANRTDAEANPLLALSFTDAGLTQFCTSVWMPPLSKRTILTPVLPGTSEARRDAAEIETRLVQQKADGEHATPAQQGRIILREGRYDSGLMGDPGDDWPRALVSAIRESAGLKPTNVNLTSDESPLTADAYEALDCVFLSRADLSMDPRRVEALRTWLWRGGRVWLLLDEAPAEWGAALLGDAWDLSVIDTVQVTRFSIEGPGGVTPQQLDYGVPLVRVCAPGFDVTHRVNGSPAALRRSVGRGEIIVTTLAARGWLSAGRAATPALKELQSFVAPLGADHRLDASAMNAFDRLVREEIGYRVLSRGWVIAAFGVCLTAIGATGLWLARRGRLELAAFAGIAAGLASSVILVVGGTSRQTQTPTTVATAQIIQYDAHSPDAECLARTSVYVNPADADQAGSIRFAGAGSINPERNGSGRLMRLIWDDPEAARMVGLDMRGGAVQSLTSRRDVAVASSPKAVIGFGPDGISGRLEPAGFVTRGQPILATPTGHVMLTTDSENRLNARLDDAPAHGEFATGSLLTQSQITRQQVCRDLLESPAFPAVPSVLVWTDPLPGGPEYSAAAQPRGAALAVIPVEFDRPAPGSPVAVPAPLMRMSSWRRPVGKRPVSTIFSEDKREWITGVHQPMLVIIRFQPPAALIPMSIDSAVLSLDLRAPGRDFDIVTPRGDKLQILESGSNPGGRLAINLTGDRAPAMLSDGSILIGLDVKPAGDPSKDQGWSVRSMDLSVTGRTQ